MNTFPLETWTVCILCCSDGTYYTGCTSNLQERIGRHNRAEVEKTEINADLIVLTETSSAINLEPDYYPVRTEEYKKFPAEQWVTIWSKWEAIKQI